MDGKDVMYQVQRSIQLGERIKKEMNRAPSCLTALWVEVHMNTEPLVSDFQGKSGPAWIEGER